MYNSEEVERIRNVAKALPDPNKPSSHLMEFLVDKADEPGCGVEELCMAIDSCFCGGKMTEGAANALIELMRLFPDSDDKVVQQEIQRKRAMALRYVNRLRGCRQYDERIGGR